MKLYIKIGLFFFIICNLSFGQEKTGSVISIEQFGAVGDGITMNTKAIQTAINTANKQNKGTVVFPKGKFLSGSIQLKSNVTLYFEEGAVLLGSTHPKDYLNMEFEGRPTSPKKDDNSQMALILAHKANHIQLKGKGEIDGQGLKLALNIDSLHHVGATIDPNYNNRRHRPNETMRPKLFRFSQCDNILVKDLKVGQASCWGLSFELCSNLILDRLTIVNRAYWNNDGMDITDCKNVKITNCNINSADDGICLKSYYPNYCNDSIYIANCTIKSSASAIKFGTASYGGFKNVTISNIKIYDTFRSAIAIESVDGAVIENIEVSNITAQNTGNAIFIRLGHRDGAKPGVVKNIHIHDVSIQIPFGRPDINYDMRGPAVNFFHNPIPSSITGIPEYPVENVLIENVEITCPGRASKGMAYIPLSRLSQVPEEIKGYPEFTMFGELPSWGFYVRHVKGITFKNVHMKLDNEDYRPTFVFDQSENIDIKNVEIPKNKKAQIVLNKSKVNTMDNDTELLIVK